METITRNVTELAPAERSALESVVGHSLQESQQIVLSISDAQAPNPRDTELESLLKQVPDFWKVYEGLDDDRIEELTAAINQRANFTRSFE